jgi:hypothetical protein
MGPIEFGGPISNLPAGIVLQLDSQKRELAVCSVAHVLALPLGCGFVLIGLRWLGLFAPVACVRDSFAVIMSGASQLNKALASTPGVSLYRVEELIFRVIYYRGWQREENRWHLVPAKVVIVVRRDHRCRG